MKKRGAKEWDDTSKMKGMVILKIKFKGRKEVALERRRWRKSVTTKEFIIRKVRCFDKVMQDKARKEVGDYGLS